MDSLQYNILPVITKRLALQGEFQSVVSLLETLLPVVVSSSSDGILGIIEVSSSTTLNNKDTNMFNNIF